MKDSFGVFDSFEVQLALELPPPNLVLVVELCSGHARPSHGPRQPMFVADSGFVLSAGNPVPCLLSRDVEVARGNPRIPLSDPGGRARRALAVTTLDGTP